MPRLYVAPLILATLPSALGIQAEDLRIQPSRRHRSRQSRKQPRMPVGSCLGELCVPHPRDYRYFQPAKGTVDLSVESVVEYDAEARGCAAKLPHNTKVMVMLSVPAHHGSTALESVFMSSDKVTTLCSAGQWQCEARLDIVDGKPDFISTNLLARYSQYWNMSRDVLLEKGPRGYKQIIREYPELQQEMQEDPELLQRYGMQNLQFAYVLMWRPLCLALLSKHTSDGLWHDPHQFAMDEMWMLVYLVRTYEYLQSKGVPVIVTNLADMMWRTEYSKHRLENFLPCVAPLDFGYMPQLGKDVLKSNQWKVQGSVESFGETVDPMECCSYDVRRSQCRADKQTTWPFNLLSEEDRARAQEAMKFLQSKS